MEIYNLEVLLHAKTAGMAAFKEAENGFVGVSKAALAAGAILAGAVVIGAIEAYKKTEALGQAAYDMGEKFGLSGGQASGWISVAQQLGISGDSVGTAFKFMSKNAENMRLTLEATGKVPPILAQAYKDLGVNVLNSSGHIKNNNDLMLDVADRFKAMKDGPEKAALAVKLFGRSGSDLIPVLNQGRDGIQSMIDQGVKLGTVMSTDQVDSIHKAFLAHKQFDAALEGLTNRIGMAVMPIMTKFFDWITNTAVPAVGRLSAWFMAHLWPAIMQIVAAIGQFAHAFMGLMAPAIQYIRDHIEDLKPVLIALGVAFLVAIAVVVLVIAAVIAIVIGLAVAVVWMAGQVKAYIKRMQDDWTSLVGFIRGLPSAVSRAASGMWNGIWNAFKAMLNMIIRAWDSLHFTIGGGNFAGVTIPSMTLSVPQIPVLDWGGVVPGPAGSRQIVAALGGERFGGAQSIGGGTTINNFYIDGLYADGPGLDRLSNALAQRRRFSTGI